MSGEIKKDGEGKDATGPVIGTHEFSYSGYVPDYAGHAARRATFESRGVFVVMNCFARGMERLLQHNNRWSVVGRMGEHELMIQVQPAPTISVSAWSNDELNEYRPPPYHDPPHGNTWLRGATPLDQKMLNELYNEFHASIVLDESYVDGTVLYLVLSIHPLRMVRMD